MAERLEFLIDGSWCQLAPGHPGNPPVVLNADDYQHHLVDHDGWNALGFAVIDHPVHGEVRFVPRSFPVRVVSDG